ncbi:hypothetical protein CABS03_09026 [Colletotrichum abscissum]|uniref:Uncharacterized protein n=1 Tax=Colletotrichum abscissum TaxID=1671311 RepID=A0A9Q0AYD6_9PEZI|nr:hypothetical protein CABS02_09287 [Colletotrichum abscissum]
MRNLDVIPTPTPPIILFLRAQITGWAVPWHTHTHSHRVLCTVLQASNDEGKRPRRYRPLRSL